MIDILKAERITVLHKTFDSTINNILPANYMLYLQMSGRTLPIELAEWFAEINEERLRLISQIYSAGTEYDIMRISVSPTTRRPSDYCMPGEPVNAKTVKAIGAGKVSLGPGESMDSVFEQQPISAVVLDEIHVVESFNVSNEEDSPLISIQPDYIYWKDGKKKTVVGAESSGDPVKVKSGILSVAVSRQYAVYSLIIEVDADSYDQINPVFSFTGASHPDIDGEFVPFVGSTKILLDISNGVSCDTIDMSGVSNCSIRSVRVMARRLPINMIGKVIENLSGGTCSVIADNDSISYILYNAAGIVLNTFSGSDNRDITVPSGSRLVFTLPASSFSSAHISLTHEECMRQPVPLTTTSIGDYTYRLMNAGDSDVSGDLIITFLE